MSQVRHTAVPADLFPFLILRVQDRKQYYTHTMRDTQRPSTISHHHHQSSRQPTTNHKDKNVFDFKAFILLVYVRRLEEFC
jgi:hypothetical protein